jgi:hypothetical protein
VYSNITGVAGATGSAVFISEAIWAGGLPMTIGSTNTCDVVANSDAGWCWQDAGTTGNPSNAWDKHEQIVAYFTNSLAPATVAGYNVTNTILSSGSTGARLGNFTLTLNSDYLTSDRPGPDNFNNPDVTGTTDFNNSIPSLRQGELANPAELETLVSANLASLQMGDYILIDPINTNGGAHGLLVVGWGPIQDCGDSFTTRQIVSNFTVSRTSTNTAPYVADFTRAQSATPRPFYCSIYYDQTQPVVGYFNRHDWYFYTIANTISINTSQIYTDANWQWDASAGQ